MGFDAGASMVRTSGGSVSFYDEYTTTNMYVSRPFTAIIHSITVTNDSLTDTVTLSFDGATVVSTLKAEESITIHSRGYDSVYVRGAAGGGIVRIWGR
jgi:hypothetical protein